jgi:transposase, IS30 family
MIYTQLTQGQRYQIKVLLDIGCKRTKIAQQLGVDKSTISRELRRNRGRRGYRPKQAQEKALERRNKKVQPNISAETWQIVDAKLLQDWSPEQITGWLKKEQLPSISPEWIYQYVYADKRAGGTLHKHLRCQKKRRKRYGQYDRRGIIPARRSIEARPEAVDLRERLGDWESDTIIGKGHQGAVLTLTERKSRFTLIRKVTQRSAELVAKNMLDLLSWVHHRKTITSDNGKEFAAHQMISKELLIDFFFAHPYAAWERGTNENANGLVRQYLPKDRDLSTVSAQEEIMIMDRLNLRPRKCLDFKTPFEVFFEHQLVALTS